MNDLYVNLLTKASVKSTAKLAHPAFVNIISDLSPDEALMLYKLKQRRYAIVKTSRTVGAEDSPTYIKFGEIEQSIIENEFPTAELSFAENFPMYLDHLGQLGILVTRPVGSKLPPGHGVRLELRLTDLGLLFCEACVPDKLPANEKIS